MILEKNELKSQNIQEFTGLLTEYIKIKPSKIIEIGSLYGWTLRHFIHHGLDKSTVVSIDLPVRDFVGPGDWRVEKQENNYKNVWPLWAKEKKCKLHLIPSQSQNPQTLKKVKDIFNQTLIDFLFIDGDHSYLGVKTDYKMYGPMVRKGGLIAFHDIGKNEEGGVCNLWDSIKHNYNDYKEFLFEDNQEKGIGVLYV